MALWVAAEAPDAAVALMVALLLAPVEPVVPVVPVVLLLPLVPPGIFRANMAVSGVQLTATITSPTCKPAVIAGLLAKTWSTLTPHESLAAA